MNIFNKYKAKCFYIKHSLKIQIRNFKFLKVKSSINIFFLYCCGNTKIKAYLIPKHFKSFRIFKFPNRSNTNYKDLRKTILNKLLDK